MCRLFGVRASCPIDVAFPLTAGPRPFRQLGAAHPNGWGIGWYEAGNPLVKKEKISATRSGTFPTVAARVRSHIALSHVRKATCGGVATHNCHPFRYRQWLFAHNGSVDRDDLLSRLLPGRRALLRGQTDSEVYFHWILQNCAQRRSVLAGLRQALRVMKNYTALNFLLTDGSTLYAYRNAARAVDHYSLYFLRRDAGVARREATTSTPPPSGGSTRSADATVVLVCSEHLSDEPWEPVPLGSLLAVSASMATRVQPVE